MHENGETTKKYHRIRGSVAVRVGCGNGIRLRSQVKFKFSKKTNLKKTHTQTPHS